MSTVKRVVFTRIVKYPVADRLQSLGFAGKSRAFDDAWALTNDDKLIRLDVIDRFPVPVWPANNQVPRRLQSRGRNAAANRWQNRSSIGSTLRLGLAVIPRGDSGSDDELDLQPVRVSCQIVARKLGWLVQIDEKDIEVLLVENRGTRSHDYSVPRRFESPASSSPWCNPPNFSSRQNGDRRVRGDCSSYISRSERLRRFVPAPAAQFATALTPK